MHAAKVGCTEVVMALLASRADIHRRSAKGACAINHAVRECFQLLFPAAACPGACKPFVVSCHSFHMAHALLVLQALYGFKEVSLIYVIACACICLQPMLYSFNEVHVMLRDDVGGATSGGVWFWGLVCGVCRKRAWVGMSFVILMLMTSRGILQIVRALIAAGAPLDFGDNDG